ncbi:MAG: putative ABC transporter permease [Roseburia intestinalis]
MPQNCYELVWIFIIYAFIGWCTEVSYAALDRGIFVNRGFLNGPYCPIYGCGVVIVVAVLTPLKDNLLILFIGSFLLTSILEYITGYLLEKVFHNQWWDYSDKPFNIHGYVCLKFSIYWGLACTFIMDVLHPIIYKGITLMPHIVGMILICIIMTVFFVDCGITVATILKFNKRLKVMDEMAERIHKLSDEIGENIYENVTDIVEKSGEFQETHAELLDKLVETTGAAKDKIAETTGTAKNKITGTTETAREKIAETTGNAKLAISENIMEAKSSFEAKKNAWTEKSEEWKKNREKQKAELSELSEKYEHLFEEKNFGFRRLMKAFPDMKSRENDKTLTEFKKHFHLDKLEQK